jgi:general secretion pathway protein B
MSLILDALKKSEAERQRQAGPTLLEVRVARPQRRFPIWALVVGALLLINMLLLFFVFLRPANPNPPAPAATSQPLAATAPAMAPAAGPARPPVAATTAPLTPAPAVPPSANPAEAAPTVADDSVESRVNPADEQPAIARTPGTVTVQRDQGVGYSNLPSFSEMSGNLPEFRLDLHVYAERARDRYALINMHAVHEGDALPEGARVLAITREGVALDYHGQQFMLRPQ